MKLSKIISVFESDIEDFEEGQILKIKKDDSWSGEENNKEFVNEWNKGVKILINFNAKKDDFTKLKMSDVDEIDILEIDIDEYDEYRANREIQCIIKDFSDGREDIGYIVIDIDYLG